MSISASFALAVVTVPQFRTRLFVDGKKKIVKLPVTTVPSPSSLEPKCGASTGVSGKYNSGSKNLLARDVALDVVSGRGGAGEIQWCGVRAATPNHRDVFVRV